MDSLKEIFMAIGCGVVLFTIAIGICAIIAYLHRNDNSVSKRKTKKTVEISKENKDGIYLPEPVKKILRFSKKVLLFSFISVGIFTVVIIILHITTGSVPDTLISEFFGFFKVEGGVLGIIKITETIVDKIIEYLREKKGSKNNENMDEEACQ